MTTDHTAAGLTAWCGHDGLVVDGVNRPGAAQPRKPIVLSYRQRPCTNSRRRHHRLRNHRIVGGCRGGCHYRRLGRRPRRGISRAAVRIAHRSHQSLYTVRRVIIASARATQRRSRVRGRRGPRQSVVRLVAYYLGPILFGGTVAGADLRQVGGRRRLLRPGDVQRSPGRRATSTALHSSTSRTAAASEDVALRSHMHRIPEASSCGFQQSWVERRPFFFRSIAIARTSFSCSQVGFSPVSLSRAISIMRKNCVASVM